MASYSKYIVQLVYWLYWNQSKTFLISIAIYIFCFLHNYSNDIYFSFIDNFIIKKKKKKNLIINKQLKAKIKTIRVLRKTENVNISYIEQIFSLEIILYVY